VAVIRFARRQQIRNYLKRFPRSGTSGRVFPVKKGPQIRNIEDLTGRGTKKIIAGEKREG